MSTTLLYADILSFAARDALAEEIAQIILDRVGGNTQLAADIAARTGDAFETLAGRARVARMEAAIREQQAAAQAAQDRGTERDPEVISARERFGRLTSANLQLLHDAPAGLSPAEVVAIRLLIAERATKALAQVPAAVVTPPTMPAGEPVPTADLAATFRAHREAVKAAADPAPAQVDG